MKQSKTIYFRTPGILAVLGLFISQATQAQPTIDISGLGGAEHWAWVNGTTFTSGNGNAAYENNVNVSGYLASGPNNVYSRNNGFQVGTASWDIYAPAAMTSGTKIYVRGEVADSDNEMIVRANGDVTSPAGSKLLYYSDLPIAFLDWEVSGENIGPGMTTGALSGGNNSFSFEGVDMTRFIVNGLLLYDGSPELRGVQNNGTGRRWLLNPGSIDSPELAGIVAPLINVGGLEEGNIVQYYLNGVAYTPGTPIAIGEDYELVVEVYADGSVNSDRIAFAGANFSVIPEPQTYSLLFGTLMAVVFMVRRRKA